MRDKIDGVAAFAKQARHAGILYFLVALMAPFSLIYVPHQLYVREDATATADHIRASESLFRIGITTELLHEVLWVFVVFALYELFRTVHESRARQMLIVGALIPVPIVSINVLNEIAAMLLVSGANFLTVFNRQQLDALALLFCWLVPVTSSVRLRLCYFHGMSTRSTRLQEYLNSASYQSSFGC